MISLSLKTCHSASCFRVHEGIRTSDLPLRSIEKKVDVKQHEYLMATIPFENRLRAAGMTTILN